MCQLQMSYKSSITNLKKHIERKHSTVKIPQKSVMCVSSDIGNIENVVDSASVVITTTTSCDSQQSSASCISTATRDIPEPPEQPVIKKRRIMTQERITSFSNKKLSSETKKSIDSNLLLLFTMDFQPFSIVEDVGFKTFVQSLNPSYYRLPNRQTISKTLIPALYERCLNRTKEAAQNILNVCITTDCWTSANNESFIAITGHFIDDKFQMRSILLECDLFEGSHTGTNLSKTLIDVANSWGLQKKVILAVSDNAANIKKAIANTGWEHFGCFAHTLNLTVQDALKLAQGILIKVKTIVAHFKRSNKAIKMLFDTQIKNGVNIPLKVIQDVPTRWNSTYHIVERFVDLEKSLRSTLGLLDDSLPTISGEEWTILKELCQILEPFADATNCVSGENYMSASLVIVLTRGLLNVCDDLSVENFNEQSKDVLNCLRKGLLSRLGNVEYSDTLAICTLLDPRFKYFVFKDSDAVEKVKKVIITALTEIINAQCERHEPEPIPSTSSNPVSLLAETEQNKAKYSLWDSLDKNVSQFKPKVTPSSRAIIEFQRYLEDEVVSRSKNPLDWWRENEHNYPYLSRLVRARCCALATSVPCESYFSQFTGNNFKQLFKAFDLRSPYQFSVLLVKVN
ncbi:zinc finger BED domain-containing protein 4-like [Diabrotica undecimpunctata]|uniref:zinc finger BED domain-containing protein 4-like n=1 Tax=Diabrotica undecimpunctata TaxID=50387 RepID=UPI003B63AE42